jgi:hypothetical protein
LAIEDFPMAGIEVKTQHADARGQRAFGQCGPE